MMFLLLKKKQPTETQITNIKKLGILRKSVLVADEKSQKLHFSAESEQKIRLHIASMGERSEEGDSQRQLQKGRQIFRYKTFYINFAEIQISKNR